MRLRLSFLLCLSVTAQLQKQASSNKQHSDKPVDKPAVNQPITDPSKNSSEAAMKQALPIATQVPPDAHKEQDGAQRVKEINDTLLVIFTGLLFIVGALQWWVLRKHEEWMQKHDANLVKLAKFAADNAAAADEAANVARQTLVSSFRPQIIVRSIALHTDWNLRYAFANRGGTRAHVVASNITGTDITRVNGWLPAIPPYSENRDVLGEITLAPGDYRDGSITLETGIIQQIKSDRESKRLGSGQPGSVHCLGYIQYRDDNGVVRYTAFCQVFNVQRDRFVAVDDPEYEYAD
jgi:hypothetical protein